MKITAIMSCAYGYDAKSSTTTDFDDYFYPNNSWRIMSHVKSNKLYYSDGYSSASYTDRSYIPVLDWCLGTTPTGIAVPSTMIFSPFSLRNGRPEGSGGNQLDYTKGYWRFGVHVPGLNRIIGGINTSNLTGNQGSP
jgi:hypothetical protein